MRLLLLKCFGYPCNQRGFVPEECHLLSLDCRDAFRHLLQFRGNESHESMHHLKKVSSGSLDVHKASKSCLLSFSFYIVCDKFSVFYTNSSFPPKYHHLFSNFSLILPAGADSRTPLEQYPAVQQPPKLCV